LFALAPAALALIAAQFALAGFGAFTMDKTPTDNVYGPHVVVGLAVAVLTLLILAAVLASRTARAHSRTLWAAVTLAVLAVPVQSVLGEAGKTIPAAGALHGLNGVIIFALAAWLTVTTSRRRAASQPTWAPAPLRGGRDSASRADRR
jgi:cytochrome b561